MKTAQEREQKIANQLLNASLSYARLILRKYGELGPFGFSIDRDGNVHRETVEIPRLPSDPSRLWKLLGEHVAEKVRGGEVQAVAVAANVTLREPSREGYADAIVLTIERSSGPALEVTVPYRIYGGHFWTLLPRRIALGELQVAEQANQFFTRREGSGAPLAEGSLAKIYRQG